MLPAFNSDGNLPPGIHWATWPEFVEQFGMTPHRRRLLEGLKSAAVALSRAGCQTLYVDGSFVTKKETPNDFDACWDISGVDPNLLDPILLNFDNSRAIQKTKYLGELFPVQFSKDSTKPTFLDFFQVDKHTGRSKGIVALDIQRTRS